MTRRNGIIAAIAGMIGSHLTALQSGPVGKVRYLTLDLTPAQESMGGEIDMEASKRHWDAGGSPYVVSMKPLPPPVARGLEVRYGDRVVRFTPEEIMDALERK